MADELVRRNEEIMRKLAWYRGYLTGFVAVFDRETRRRAEEEIKEFQRSLEEQLEGIRRVLGGEEGRGR